MFASMVKVFWSACSEIYATDIISRQYFHDQHIGKIRIKLKGLAFQANANFCLQNDGPDLDPNHLTL